jgi:hypothetical protein
MHASINHEETGLHQSVLETVALRVRVPTAICLSLPELLADDQDKLDEVPPGPNGPALNDQSRVVASVCRVTYGRLPRRKLRTSEARLRYVVSVVMRADGGEVSE